MIAAINPGTPKGCERIAYAVGFKENATYSDVYGGGGAIVGLDCHLIRPIDHASDTLIVFMHPVGGGMYLTPGAATGKAGAPCAVGQLPLPRRRLCADNGESCL